MFTKNVGLTKGDQLAAVSTASAAEEFATLEKRARPKKLTFTLKNNSVDKVTYSLMCGIGAVELDNEVPAFYTEVAGGGPLPGLALITKKKIPTLLIAQKALIVGMVLSVNTDANAAQLNEDVRFVKVDFNDNKVTSLKPHIDEAKPLSKDEALSRVVDVKFVLDESTDLHFDVNAGESLTVTLNIKEFLNRSW